MTTVRILVAREHGRRSMEYARAVGRRYALQVRPGHDVPLRRVVIEDANRHTLRAARIRRR